MAYLNRLTLIGTLTEEPRLAPESLGRNAATLNVVCTEYWEDLEGKEHESKDFFTIVLYGAPAGYAAMNLGKNSEVLIIGKIRNKRWFDNDKQCNKSKTVVIVDRAEGLQSISGNPPPGTHAKPEQVQNQASEEGAKNSKPVVEAGSEEFEKQNGLQPIPF